MTSAIHWVPTTANDAAFLMSIAVTGGYEGDDRHQQSLWVIRAMFEGDLLPGTLNTGTLTAYVPWGHEAHEVHNIEVCCAPPYKIKWIESKDGEVPPRAVPGGKTAAGETLYIGRANEQNSLLIGKIQPSHGVIYMPYNGKEIQSKVYKVLCTVEF